MLRDSHIPLFLWLATAALVHLTWAGGTDKVISVLEERLVLKEFALSVKQLVRAKHRTFEVALYTDEQPIVDERNGQASAPDQSDPESSDDLDEIDSAEDEAQPKQTPSTPVLEQKPEQSPEDNERPVPEPKAPEPVPEPKPDLKLFEEEPKPNNPQRLELVQPEHKRIAVEQDVKDPNQAPNPDAALIADHANHVAEETQARLTNTEEHQSDPTLSGAHTGPGAEPGNSDETQVAQLEDAPGEQNRAPDQNKGVRAQEASGVAEARRGAARELEATSQQSRAALRAVPGRKPQEEIAENADVLRAAEGRMSMNDAHSAQDARRGRKARSGLPEQKRSTNPSDLFGLGAQGITENGINLNLSHMAALDTVGNLELDRARRRDAERRRSEHRGSTKAVGLERWRSAIENYVPSVKIGNQTALNTAGVPFASYINRVHNKIHPIFAHEFLGSLDSLPASHPLRQSGLSTSLEIVVNRLEGRFVKMGIVKASGVTAFDIGALESVFRAIPFGPAPEEIASPDGNVYLHWEFHKYPYACGTFNARPFLLKSQPQPAPTPAPKPNEKRFDDEHPGDAAEHFGWLDDSEQWEPPRFGMLWSQGPLALAAPAAIIDE